MGMKQMYLIAFNFSLAAGWAQILASIVRALLASCAPTDCRGLLPFGLATSQLCVCGDLHAQTQTALAIFQTAAVLEVLHSLFGVVRAPLFTTFIQVLSRLLLLWGIVVPFPATHTMPRFATMILAWSLTEVIRYSFYGFGLVLGKAPYPLVWLRYTLFFVLYPLGVGSEISLIYASLDDLAKVGMRGAFCFGIAAYLPGFPILYMHMISQRKKVLGGGRPKRKESGIVFPPGPKGDRSTTAAGKDAFAAAAAAVSDAAAAKVRKEKVWRYGYTKHVVQQVEMCSKSKGDCIKIADAGLKYLHENFEFIRDDKTTKFSEALTTIKGSFETGVMKGAEPMPKGCKLTVPYERGYSLLEPCTKTIEGKELLDQVAKWAKEGVIEQSCCDAISSVVNHESEWCNLSGHHVCLLGATSAMGPITTLLRLGATVYAVDIDRPAVWKKLFAMTEASPGTLVYPLKSKPRSGSHADLAEVAGCNLMEQPAEITTWLAGAAEAHAAGAELAIGMYGYLDAALHVKLSLGADAVMAGVSERYSGPVALAYLCTPTDAFTIPKGALQDSVARYEQRGIGAQLAAAIGLGLTPNHKPSAVQNVGGVEFAVIDGIVGAQGPNYILSKRMQAWRAMTARAAGQRVSINVAPSTATASVVSNKSFAAAFEGMGKFAPMEILREETSRAVMSALLIYDLRNPDSTANPATALPGDNPIHLFMHGSFHGGIWRGAYKFDTIGTVAAGSIYLKWYLPYVAVALLANRGISMAFAQVVAVASTGMDAFML